MKLALALCLASAFVQPGTPLRGARPRPARRRARASKSVLRARRDRGAQRLLTAIQKKTCSFFLQPETTRAARRADTKIAQRGARRNHSRDQLAQASFRPSRRILNESVKRKRLGREIRSRGMKGNIRSIYSTEYNLSLFELLKSYSTIIMTKDFQKMNIPKLPVFTAEDGIKTIREFFGKLIDWKKLDDLIPKNFKSGSKYKRTGKAGIFAGSLELVKEGNLTMKQDKLFDDIYVKENND